MTNSFELIGSLHAILMVALHPLHPTPAGPSAAQAALLGGW